MRTSEIFDSRRGRWFAVATDDSGYVVTTEEVADHCAFVIVGRGTAEPIGARIMPEAAEAADVLYELDLVGEDPEQVVRFWEQAQAVADGLNAVQTMKLIEASSLGTPEAKALRSTVSHADARAVVARSKEIAAESGPAVGQFCDEHFSWLCQAGQGECQRGEADINPDEHNSVDPGCDSCGTCMACDGCADPANPVDEARGDCTACGACGPCIVNCAHQRALDTRPKPGGDA